MMQTDLYGVSVMDANHAKSVNNYTLLSVLYVNSNPRGGFVHYMLGKSLTIKTTEKDFDLISELDRANNDITTVSLTSLLSR